MVLDMTLYIIGNGFDLEHKIDSRYSDFREFLLENYWDYYDEIMCAFEQSEYLWKDFESELPTCAVNIENAGLSMGSDMLDQIDYDPMDDMGIGDWLDMQFGCLEELPYYLRRWVESLDIKKDQVLKIDKESYFLTFNYTATLEEVYEVEPERIKHIHGFVKNEDEELIYRP